MHPTLTLEGGRSFYSRDFTKANLQVAIQSIQPGTALPTRKPDLQSLLSSLIKTELVGRGKYGSLPDWRRIDSLTVADLKKEILALHGSVLGNKSNLCGELERLNPAALGHSPRSTLSPEAPPFFPADVVTDPLGLLPLQPPQSPSVPAPPPLQAPVPPQPPPRLTQQPSSKLAFRMVHCRVCPRHRHLAFWVLPFQAQKQLAPSHCRQNTRQNIIKWNFLLMFIITH